MPLKTKKQKKNKKESYESWSRMHKLKDKKMYDIVSHVWEYYNKSRDNLLTSCYWDSYQEANTGLMLNGGDWYERWNMHDKQSIMWHTKGKDDDFASNIKSPMARGRINTFGSWMKKVNLEFGASPNNEDDKNPSIVADKLINYWFRNSDAKLAFSDAWEECAKHGSSFLKLSYVKETRKYSFPKIKGYSKEEKEKLSKGEIPIVYSDPEEKTVIDDIVLEHVPIRELFPDPQARFLHGTNYVAGWVIRRRYVTMEYVKAVYDNHPNAKYVDKVKPGTAYDNSDYFFEPPKDYESDNIVELLEMEDTDNDKYYVVANDICIIGYDGEQPLPNNHKESSYFKLDYVRVPGQFYGMGICDLTENLQGAYEIALNMVADYVYRTYNHKFLVRANSFGEVTQGIERIDDDIIPITAADGMPLNSVVQPLTVAPISFDIFSFIELLERNATLATNIDPAQMAMLAGSKTATSDMLNKELLMTMIGGVVQSNVDGDIRALGRQVWKLQQQHLSMPRVEKVLGKDDKPEYKLKPRTIRFDGIELKLNEDTGILEEKEIELDESFFELTDEYLNTRDELDIYIKPESMEVQSQALKEQKAEAELAQLMPLAVDPNNPQQVSQHPMGVIDINELIRNYVEDKRLPETLLLASSKDNEKSVKEAEDHMMAILMDKPSHPVPGQSKSHLEYEYQVLNALDFKAEQLEEQIQNDLETQAKDIVAELESRFDMDPNTGQFVDPNSGTVIPPEMIPQPQVDEAKQEQSDKLQEKIAKIKEHIFIESAPASMRSTRIAGMMGGGPEQGAPEEAIVQGQVPPGMQNPITPDMMMPQDPAAQVPPPPMMGGEMGGGFNPLTQPMQ